VASNIAEGFGRGSRADYLRFTRIARGSLYEVETQLEFARAFGYLDMSAGEELEQMILECNMMLAGLIRKLELAPMDKSQEF
jgi:four helix bundle protein